MQNCVKVFLLLFRVCNLRREREATGVGRIYSALYYAVNRERVENWISI